MKGRKDQFLQKLHGSWNFGFTLSIFGFFLLCGSECISVVQPPSPPLGICYTNDCYKVANSLKKNMNKWVDPCSNFYQYACGKYMQNMRIPEELGEFLYYDLLQENIFVQVNRSLNATIDTNDKKPLKLLKQFYQSCMNKDKIDLDKTEVQNKIIEAIRLSGGWPMLAGDSWNEENFDWLNMSLKFQELGYLEDSFFSTALTREGNHMKIVPLGSRIHSEAHNVDYDSYKKLITSTAKLFGAANEVRVNEEMLLVENFMKELDKAKQDNPDKHWMTIPGLQQNFPNIRWTQYVKAQVPVPDTFSKIQQVLLIDPEYIRKLQSSIAQTPKRTIANYIVSKVIKNIHDSSNIGEFGRRWVSCMEKAKNQLPIAFSSVYIQDHYDREHHPLMDVNNMVSYVNKTFVDMIQQNTWMNDRYKSLLVTKLNTMKVNVGYPEELLNNTKIDEYYKNIELSDSHFENVLKLQKFQIHQKMINLEQPIDHYNWTEFAKATGDVFETHFERESNTFQFPAAFMQDLHSYKALTKALKYGKLGWEIAREFARSFSPDGICYNERGEKNDTRANVLKSMPGYKSIVESLTTLYSNYSVKKGLKINGTNTLDENFADIFGLRAAYKAYEKDAALDRERGFPMIDRSPRQMFWLGYASTHCSKIRDYILRDLIATNTYSPTKARILMPLRLVPEFSRDYNCAPGSPMNNVNNEYANAIKNAFS